MQLWADYRFCTKKAFFSTKKVPPVFHVFAPKLFFFRTKFVFFSHQNNFFPHQMISVILSDSAPNLFWFCTKMTPNLWKLGQNYIDFAPNISWIFSGLAPNISRFCTNLSQISTKCVDAIQNKSSITTLLHQISLIFQIWPPVSQFC